MPSKIPKSPEKQTWFHMLHRTNPLFADRPDNRYHSGRGIKVCDRWRESFDDFLEDMGPRPPGTTLERTNNDGNYEPTNCRWATPAEQAANRRLRKMKYRNNTSGTPGVSYHQKTGTWHASIQVHSRSIQLGYHRTKDEAAAARKAAELKYWGAEVAA